MSCNLVGFDKLVKLQLDNNIIETIENLDHLQCLEWLDLSFNNISEISGLTALTQLTNLSLFSNRVTKLEGMDTLLNLEVLSVGGSEAVQQDVSSCLGELLEDTPSMTAFSSERSALSKELLLFVVHVGGSCEITPELRSRASLVL